MHKVYELLKDYENKDIDKDFYRKAFELIVEEDELQEYAKDIKIVNDSEEVDTLGNYRINDKLVTINMNVINNKYFSPKCNMTRNVYCLHVVKHELNHAKAIKDINLGKKDIKTTVIKMSLLDYLMENGYYHLVDDKYTPNWIRFLIKENYEIDPGERIAEIDAWKYVINLIKNRRKSDELLYARTRLYYALSRGYKDNGININCPTYEFLLELNQLREFKLIKKKVEGNTYPLEKRLECGLPITNRELDNKILKMCGLQKKRL